MMTTNSKEGALQKRITGWLKRHPDIWFLKVYGSAVQTTGVPDLILCKNGKFVALELKRTDGKGVLRAVQRAHLDRINNAGGVGVVIDDFDDFIRLMEKL